MPAPRIRFSTTRGWNPGDEVINRGICQLFNELDISYAPLIYNRSPFAFEVERARAEISANASDYVVFAGSPEWWQESVPLRDALRYAPSLRRVVASIRPGRAEKVNDLLLDEIVARGVRCSFIGVGSSKPPLAGPKLARVLSENCDVFTVRDRQTADAFSRWHPQLLPCPALFSATARERSEKVRVGVALQKPNRGMIRIDSAEMAWMDREVAALLARVPDAELIAHTAWDAEYLAGKYPGRKLNVARTGENLVACYDRFDFVASTRLHGCIVACSLGIPVYQLNYGLRMEALNEFPVLNRREHGDLVEAFETLESGTVSRTLIDFKERNRQAYHEALKPLRDAVN